MTPGMGTSSPYPNVWGDGQPKSGNYAYINLSPPSGYDTGLAYANSVDKPEQEYPFVCTY
jgi:hypothetical protein